MTTVNYIFNGGVMVTPLNVNSYTDSRGKIQSIEKLCAETASDLAANNFDIEGDFKLNSRNREKEIFFTKEERDYVKREHKRFKKQNLNGYNKSRNLLISQIADHATNKKLKMNIRVLIAA